MAFTQNMAATFARQPRRGLTQIAKDAPPTLGPPAPHPPDPSGLPPGARRVMSGMGLALGFLFGSSDAEHSERLAGRAGTG